MTARSFRSEQGDPTLEEIRLPLPCRRCLTQSASSLVEMRSGRPFSIRWDEDWQPAYERALALAADDEGAGEESPGASHRIKVGILGNPLIVYDPFMNEGIIGLLKSLNAEPVVPKPQNLEVEDVRYFDQLDEFEREGVQAVLYMQNFSCLKGHVHARGSLHELRRRYPSMMIAVIDYDPESSALNRENRIRLVVSSAQKRQVISKD